MFNRDFSNHRSFFEKFCSIKMFDLLHSSVVLCVRITVVTPEIKGTSSGLNQKTQGEHAYFNFKPVTIWSFPKLSLTSTFIHVLEGHFASSQRTSFDFIISYFLVKLSGCVYDFIISFLKYYCINKFNGTFQIIFPAIIRTQRN